MSAYRLTALQLAMLEKANAVSFPGDGLRIKGPGQHRVASNLADRGYVWIQRPAGEKARVHINGAGRALLRERPTEPSGHGHDERTTEKK